tara:strand:+ start:889 stop:1470 length:582 start_codon:yes stop_codon:yes gene_type:complete
MAESFIYNVPNVLSSRDCQSIIDCIESNIDISNKEHVIKPDSSLLKLFRSLTSNQTSTFEKYDTKIKNILSHHFKIYFNTYMDNGMTHDIEPIDIIDEIKYQKFNPPGHFDWHFEQGPAEHSKGRFLVWMIYLNTIKESGSTDFYYQQQSYQPQEGSLLMWPASFTHRHRGNPNLDTEKYIATGWFNFDKLFL